MPPAGTLGMVCTRGKARRISMANSRRGLSMVEKGPVINVGSSGFAHQGRRPLARRPGPAAGEVLEDCAVPQPHGAAPEPPAAIGVPDRLVLVVAREAQGVGRL